MAREMAFRLAQLAGMVATLAALLSNRASGQETRHAPSSCAHRGGLEFVDNQGQFGNDVEFRASSGSLACDFLATAFRTSVIESWRPIDAVKAVEAVEAVASVDPIDTAGADANLPTAVPVYGVVECAFEGASPSARVAGFEKREAIASYFLGSDPARWRAGVPTYGGIEYHDLYPGVGMRVRRADRGFEFDLLLDAGANPNEIVLRFSGARAIEHRDDGSLEITTMGGAKLAQLPPRSFEILNDGSRRPIDSRFARLDESRFQLRVPTWTGKHPLVIDPIIEQPIAFSYIGGLETDYGFDVTSFLGKPILAGCTVSTPYAITTPSIDGYPIEPPIGASPPAFQTTVVGEYSAFVSCFKPGLEELVWSTFYGSVSGSHPLTQNQILVAARGVDVDGTGGVYFGGFSNSAEIPTTATSAQPYPEGFGDGFVAKLTNNGTVLAYATYVAGSMQDIIEDVRVDPAGHAFFTGSTNSAAAIPIYATPGAACTGAGASPWPGFVGKLSTDGTDFEYLSYIGGTTGPDSGPVTRPRALALDYGDGETPRVYAVIAGSVLGAGLTVPNAYQPNPAAGPHGGYDTDAFVVIINETGSAWTFGTYLGGAGPTGDDDVALGVAVSPSHLIAVVGFTRASNFPATPNAFQYGSGGNSDAFVARIDPSASVKLQFASYHGGNGDDHATGVEIDSSGAIYCVGWSTSTTSFTILDAIQAHTPTSSASDAFAFKMRNSALLMSSFLGGEGPDVAADLKLESGSFLVAGTTRSADFRSLIAGTSTLSFDATLNAKSTPLTSFGTSPPYSPPWQLDDSNGLWSIGSIAGADAYVVKCELP